jgi:hypothetical protein
MTLVLLDDVVWSGGIVQWRRLAPKATFLDSGFRRNDEGRAWVEKAIAHLD